MKQNFKKGDFIRFFIILCKIHEKFLFLLMFHFLIVFNCFLGILFRNVNIMLRNHT
ncbi:hypothetical protein HPNQ4228_0151 [Helicobacter pylori NQ4228]|uniref:Uncharacterized protein n=1 Tax=Helicobacter pylori NQ4076 TaxID=992029 RepID=I9QCK3_HELPX|nr:hypothetical protein HPNQ4228_0151 [Helicobacter pylori NQ4228]EJB32301.1 hypothetical protein HPNQ4076_1485 [Helicobacter pylori NQ4076]EQD93601.1 hypothetical protein L935_06270 [Helicobacter pylori PZ5086]